jgi:nucleoside-diphosphate-sugar epimerase
MKALFIGGTGNISSACAALALARGIEVAVLNRGLHEEFRDPRCRIVTGDRNDFARLHQVAREGRFDVVADFVAYTPPQIDAAIRAFHNQCGHYLFISSASVYQKPPRRFLITESTPLANPFWEYARLKIACEEMLTTACRDAGFPATIVRPSYTYGPTWIPAAVGGHGYTNVDRLRRGLSVVSHGDGQSLWVLTHATDFAVGFLGLFGRREAIGEAFQITSDEVLTWDRIYQITAAAAGAEARLVHVPSDWIARIHPPWAGTLLGDKAYSVVFDNSKIRRLVPDFQARVSFKEGVARSIAWYDGASSRRVVDEQANAVLDRLVELEKRVLAQ